MPDAPLEFGIEPPPELFELAAGIRRIIERMMVIEEPHGEVAAARAAIDAVATRLERIGRTGPQARLHPGIAPGPEDHRPYYAGNARRWHYNPMLPPIAFEDTERGVRGRVTLGLPFEGPPGYAHGGVVALLLDQMLGQSNLEAGVPAMTGSLTVRYRKPTPLLSELVIEADGPERSDDRRCLTRGRILCHGEVTAEARGLFVLPTGVVFPSVARPGNR